MTLRKTLSIIGGIGVAVFARCGGFGTYEVTYFDDDRVTNNVHVKDLIFFTVVERNVLYKPYNNQESFSLIRTRRTTFLPIEVVISKEWGKN